MSHALKIAFIGAGSIAQAHLDAVRLAGAEVVGVCTRSDRGQVFADTHGIPFFTTNVSQLVESTQPDAIFLLTQPESYLEILKTLKPFNLPTMIEKPLGNTVAEAEALRPYLPDLTFVGLNRRFYGNIQAILPLMNDATEAMIQVVMPEREKDYGQYDDASIRNHWDMLQGIHLVDLVTYLAGPVAKVMGHTSWGDLPLTTTPRYTMSMVETTLKHRVSFMSNFDSPGGWRIHAFLPKAEIMIAPIEKTMVKTMTGVEEIQTTYADTAAKPGFLEQTRCFLQGVSQPQNLPGNWVSFDEALTSMKVLAQLMPNALVAH